ncbi:hypothetical protein Slin_0860 [Spirosoma linguale DSM 74]|uniref:Uncharacterized protein n=1 Tax=Spirosoma linguale (strain ATCC 33905 / DSM 74 / LMG 10896 / Claus 1) TaxID=504472 RepID=D2QI29_SPILD|nr:hypothetical protein Slin_0860 [Spirosoma linguale DSM 74]
MRRALIPLVVMHLVHTAVSSQPLTIEQIRRYEDQLADVA